MNFIILTGHFGGGHRCVAVAMEQEIRKVYPECNITILDGINYIFPKAGRYIYRIYDRIVKMVPGFYNICNLSLQNHCITPGKAFMTKKIYKMVKEYQPDRIITTMPFFSEYLSIYKARYASEVSLHTVITDIYVHQSWIGTKVNRYYVGDIYVARKLKRMGIPKEKIIISGIPVRKCFMNLPHNAKEKRKKHVLIMGGGLGILHYARPLLKYLNQVVSIHTTVITGENQRLFKKLSRTYPNLEIVGYTQNVPEYMSQADVLVTKPGGVTMTEAIWAELPLYIIKPLLIQERSNAAYIQKRQIGIVIFKKNNIIEPLLELLKDDNARIQMQKNMRKIKNARRQREKQ